MYAIFSNEYDMFGNPKFWNKNIEWWGTDLKNGYTVFKSEKDARLCLEDYELDEVGAFVYRIKNHGEVIK